VSASMSTKLDRMVAGLGRGGGREQADRQDKRTEQDGAPGSR
jgi:hypothetical protein